MSAFICSDEHFDAIYSALWGRQHKDKWRGFLMHTLTDRAALADEKIEEAVLGWRALNVEAVNFRYNDDTEVGEYRPKATLRYASMSDARLFGLLSCLVYQCTEGEHLEQDARYKTLVAIQQQAAANVAEAHPDFVWSVEGIKEKEAEARAKGEAAVAQMRAAVREGRA